jgi:hypothetical protein
LNVPLTISGVTSQSPLLSLLSNGSGDTLKVQSTSTSTSYYLLRLLSASTERFSVRNDGKVRFQRQVNATNNTASSTASFTINISSVTYTSWFYGPSAGNTGQGLSTTDFGPGNVLYADWTTSGQRIIGIPNATNSTSWRDYLANNESITLHYYAKSGKEFDGMTSVTTSGPPTSAGAYTIFSTSANYVEVTILMVGSTPKCYYSTCAGECGTLF